MHHYGKFSGYVSQGRYFSIIGSRGYHGRTVQDTLQGLGGIPSCSTTLSSQTLGQLSHSCSFGTS